MHSTTRAAGVLFEQERWERQALLLSLPQRVWEQVPPCVQGTGGTRKPHWTQRAAEPTQTFRSPWPRPAGVLSGLQHQQPGWRPGRAVPTRGADRVLLGVSPGEVKGEGVSQAWARPRGEETDDVERRQESHSQEVTVPPLPAPWFSLRTWVSGSPDPQSCRQGSRAS